MNSNSKSKKFTVLITDYAWPSLTVEESILSGIASIVSAPDTKPSTLAELAADADAIMFNWATVPESVILNAPKCVQLSRFGVGIDNIPLKLATELGIVVTNIPDYCVQEVTSHAFSLILAVNRQLLPFSQQTQIDLASPVPRISNQTLGLFGLGRQGQLMAKRAYAFDMDIIGYDPFIKKQDVTETNVRLVTFDELLSESDLISLHAPLTAETKGIFGANQFKQMKKTASIINAARGGIIDTEALVQAIQSNQIAGAALDVTEPEPLPLDHPLRSLENVILTPHVAFFSQQTLQELSRRTAQQVYDGLTGTTPENIRNPEVLPYKRTVAT